MEVGLQLFEEHCGEVERSSFGLSHKIDVRDQLTLVDNC